MAKDGIHALSGANDSVWEQITRTGVAGNKHALDVYIRGGGGGGSSADPGFSTGIPALISVSAISSIVLAANADRLFTRISNYSSVAIWLQYNAAAVIGRGQRISPGVVFEISGYDNFKGNIHAITAGATVNVDVFEGTL